MKPSIGRIVHFRAPGPPFVEDENETVCVAAIIIKVAGRECMLDVRWPVTAADIAQRPNLFPSTMWAAEGEDVGEWHWPERVDDGTTPGKAG